MSRDEHTELDEALGALRELAQARGKPKGRTGKEERRAPTRFHARDLLIALGRRILADGEAGSREDVRAARAATEPFGEAWSKAVKEELALACTEHVQGVDPRYLAHPRFDFEYVVAARERLEARLQAASALDLSVDEDLLDRVAAADRELEPHLRARRGEPEAN